MDKTCQNPNAQPKMLPKGKRFSQTTKAPKLKGMDGFASFGKFGKVKPGDRQP